jgi:UV DNA damage endonuclease
MKKRKPAGPPQREACEPVSQGLRLALCCQFANEPIAFRTTTATSLLRLQPAERRQKLALLCLENAAALEASLRYCAAHGIGGFRILSTILPVKTHPTAGYAIDELPGADAIVAAFRRCGATAAELGIRTTFHPDQFVVLNSPRADVVEKSLEDLEYHAEVAEWVGADVINIHGGGAYGDKQAALDRFARTLDRLSDRARSRLTVENDDKIFTPSDLLPLCRANGLPLVYDVHHHRCLADDLSVRDATDAAIATWNREPLFHISSPIDGWSGPRPERHHDAIDVADFPTEWLGLTATIDVEAKAKEIAVLKLRDDLAARRRAAPPRRVPVRSGA